MGTIIPVIHPAVGASAPRAGRCLGLMPAKAGDGASAVLANLAAELARDPATRVLVIDLSLPFGDIALYLTSGVMAHDLADLTDETARLDGELLDVMAHHVSPNLHLIPAPLTLDRFLRIQPLDVQRLITVAREQYDHVLIDLGLDAISLSVLDALDLLVLVATLNVASVRHVDQLVQLWSSLGNAPHKLQLVVNHEGASTAVRVADMEKAVGMNVARQLPQDNALMQASQLKGVPAVLLRPKSAFARAVIAWAQEWTGQRAQEKRTWLRFGTK